MVHGLYWLVVNACRTGPLLIAVDDLHWADRASLRFLLYLADRVEGLPIALALTWRAAEMVAAGVADCLARLEQLATGGAVLLEVLSQAAVGALLSDAFGTLPGVAPAGYVMGLGPRSVARAVAQRVARLGPIADELARAAAILGDGAALRHAAALAGIGLGSPFATLCGTEI